LLAPAARNDLAAIADFKDALERLLGRPVDLVEREAIEGSRNFIRRRAILTEAERVYG
jgi:predicted nucleotidyltransferase